MPVKRRRQSPRRLLGVIYAINAWDAAPELEGAFRCPGPRGFSNEDS